MRKLFLCSSFKDVADLFLDFSKGDPAGQTVAFIPTAALHEKMNFYVKAGKKALEKMGFQVNVMELEKMAPDEIEQQLKENDMIYVSGGNTFFLLQVLKETGADSMIKREIDEGKIYIGESAGAIITAPQIDYVKDMDDPNEAPLLKGFEGLEAVDFYPLPHHKSFPFQKITKKIILKHSENISLMPITNKQAILVDGDHARIEESKK